MTPISQMGRDRHDHTASNLRHLRNLRIFTPSPLRFTPSRATAEVAEERRGKSQEKELRPLFHSIEMIRFYFTGWAREEELMAHIDKLQLSKD